MASSDEVQGGLALSEIAAGRFGEVSRSLNNGSGNPEAKHILCYGDSITHGYPEGCPYCSYLRDALNGDEDDEQVYETTRIGIVGYSTTQMLNAVDEKDIGLRNEIRSQKRHPPYDLAIILGGTNDIPGNENLAPNTKLAVYNEAARSIANNLKDLHKIALNTGAAHTLALSIPGAKFDADKEIWREVRSRANRMLKGHANHVKKMEYLEFPIEYEWQGVNWKDRVHPTCEGYKALAEALAPTVRSMLQ